MKLEWISKNKLIGIDTETYYSQGLKGKVDCSVALTGYENYTKQPEFYAYMVAITDGENSWAGLPCELDWGQLEGCTLVAHNIRFEKAVMKNYLELDLSKFKFIDSMHLAAYLRKPLSLKKLVFDVYGEEVDKGIRASMNGVGVGDILKPSDWNKLKEYCVLDAHYSWKFVNDYIDQWPEWEREVADMLEVSFDHGVCIHKRTLKNNQNLIKDELDKFSSRLPWTEEEAPLSSPYKFQDKIKEFNIIKAPSTSPNDYKFLQWYNKHIKGGEHQEWVDAFVDYRKLKSSASKLEKLEASLTPLIEFKQGKEGNLVERKSGTHAIFHPQLVYSGNHTRRTKSGGGFNILNMEKKHPVEGVDIRGMITSRPGKELLILDYAQIEPRILAYLSKNKPLLELMKQGQSVYEAYARVAGSYSGEEALKVADPDLYATTKRQVLGLGYGMGAARYFETAKAFDVNFTELLAQEEVKNFRDNNPLIPKLWRSLDSLIKNAYESDKPLIITLPSGNKLEYLVEADPKKEGSYLGKCSETGKIVYNFWGGTLLENLCQSIARDIAKWNELQCYKRLGICSLFDVYDEFIFENNKGDKHMAKSIVDIMSETPPWIEGLPVEVEYEIATKYKK